MAAPGCARTTPPTVVTLAMPESIVMAMASSIAQSVSTMTARDAARGPIALRIQPLSPHFDSDEYLRAGIVCWGHGPAV